MSHHRIAACKRELIEVYKSALEAIKSDQLVKKAVSFNGDNIIVQDVLNFEGKAQVYPIKNRRLHVIGGGKCALEMARGLADLANQTGIADSFSHGCLSVPIVSRKGYERDQGLQTLLKSIDLTCKFGSKNNLPDEDSVEATKLMLDRIAEACQSDKRLGMGSLFIVLLSGGGSACLSSPKNVSLHEKTRIIKRLVQMGADIVELNKVRRYFSQIKGGNLAMHIKRYNPNAQIISLIISDVINDPVEFIASGPTCIKHSKDLIQTSMLQTFEKYGIDVPSTVSLNSSECDTLEIDPESLVNKVIGNNFTALQAAMKKAKNLGYEIRSLGNDIHGATGDILRYILRSNKNQDRPKVLLICGGEATVCKGENETWGLGGRAQEMALDYIISRLSDELSMQNKTVDVFLAGSTDGQDGPTDVSGCMSSYAEWLLEKSFSLEDALIAKQHHDSFNFWSQRKPDWLLKLGPTGTNVMDLYFLAIVNGRH